MTPLPWWVFLASLLASVSTLAQHPPANACARICRAQSNPPKKIAGVCDPRRLALQSDGDHSAIQRLSRLCLSPCSTPKVTGARLVFENSEHCRSFRRFLIGLKKCSCEPWGLREDGSYGDWRASWLDQLFQEYSEYGLNAENVQDRARMVLRRILRDDSSPGEMDHQDLEDSHSTKNRDGMNGPGGAGDLVGSSSNGAARKSTTVNLRAEGSKTTTAPCTTEEPPVDWEKWCMLQCDNGQGGSACNCDIIP